MWSEMLELWQAGSLRVPEGVTLVFADGGGGKIQGQAGAVGESVIIVAILYSISFVFLH